MRLFVTGAAGYLGRELIGRAPGAAGSFLETPPPAGLARAVRLDVRDGGSVARALRESSAECVIHTAYRQEGEDSREVNVDGSRAVAAAAAMARARLIHLSTDLVFDGALGRPYREGDAPNPVMPYGREKLDAERAVAEAHPAPLIVRTSLIYGGDEPSRHERLVLAASAGDRNAVFFSDELRSPVQVGDLAAALLELAALDVTGVLHVAGAAGLSRHGFARLVAAVHGFDATGLRSGLAVDHQPPRPLDCRLDSSRAQTLIGTRLRGADEVLRATGNPAAAR